jgi:hypothetical protein
MHDVKFEDELILNIGYTQFVSDSHPRVSFLKASFKMRKSPLIQSVEHDHIESTVLDSSCIIVCLIFAMTRVYITVA